MKPFIDCPLCQGRLNLETNQPEHPNVWLCHDYNHFAFEVNKRGTEIVSLHYHNKKYRLYVYFGNWHNDIEEIIVSDFKTNRALLKIPGMIVLTEVTQTWFEEKLKMVLAFQ